MNSLHKRARLKVKSGSKKRRSRERLEVVSRAAAGLGGPVASRRAKLPKITIEEKEQSQAKQIHLKKGNKNPVFAADNNEMENPKC